MRKVELSTDEICYLADILNEKISDYSDGLYHDEDGKPFYYMPDGNISYDSCEIDELPIANNILNKI
jgi:hypothetical protein